MRGCRAVKSRLKNKNNMSNVGPFNFLQHLHNTCSKRLQYIFLTCCSPCLWAAWAEWPIGFMMIQFSKIIFSPLSQMSAICKGQFARNHSFWLIAGAVGTLARGEIHCGRFVSEISHRDYLRLHATWQREDHCGKMETRCRICLLQYLMYSVFLSIAPVSPWAKNGVSSFLMTSPLMNIWCHVLAHIWKEANSQHKYLMWTLYILTSHISINYKTNMWTHNKTALLATVETLFPHYLSSCYWKAAAWALSKIAFPVD